MYTHDPFNVMVSLHANQITGKPDYIIIGGIEFFGEQGAQNATKKLIPGIDVCTYMSPYGIFEPHGIVEVMYKETKHNVHRFYFDPIDYLKDDFTTILVKLDSRFEKIIEWRQIVLNQ